MDDVIRKLLFPVPAERLSEWNRKYNLCLPDGATFMNVLLTVSRDQDELIALTGRIESMIHGSLVPEWRLTNGDA